uniref:Uncharacterized protein n=1 Tax=Arundo donax TaxID=35708 RepID=A0A0A9FDL0_ARUDO
MININWPQCSESLLTYVPILQCRLAQVSLE